MINMLESVYYNNTREANNSLSNASNLSQNNFKSALQQKMGRTVSTPSIVNVEPANEEFLPGNYDNIVSIDSDVTTATSPAEEAAMLGGDSGPTSPAEEAEQLANAGASSNATTGEQNNGLSSIMNTMMRLMQANMSMSTMTMLNGGGSGSSGGGDAMGGMMSMMMMVLLIQTISSSNNEQTETEAVNTNTVANGTASDVYNAAQAAGTMEERAAAYEDIINGASRKYNIATSLIKGIIQAESSFNANTVSHAGAQGLMQLMPGTASGLGVTDAFDPAQNIDGGTNYISKMIDRYDGDVKLALVAYNCGPGRVAQSGVTSSADANYAYLPKAARDYAEKVMAYTDNYAKAETQTAIA